MSVFFFWFSHSVLFKFWVQSFCFVPCTPVPLRRARIMNSQHVLCIVCFAHRILSYFKGHGK